MPRRAPRSFPGLAAPLAFLLCAAPAAAQIPVVHGALKTAMPPQVLTTEQPVLQVWAPERDAVFYVECTVGQARTTFTSELAPAGEILDVPLDAEPGDTAADCLLVARFGNGLSERRAERFTWTRVEPAPAPGEDPDVDEAPGMDEIEPPAPESPPPPPPEAAPGSLLERAVDEAPSGTASD